MAELWVTRQRQADLEVTGRRRAGQSLRGAPRAPRQFPSGDGATPDGDCFVALPRSSQ
jgi:hypothetical protein